MLEHLSNCHGEWNFIFAVVGSLPFVGAWLRRKINKARRGEVNENW